MLQPGYSVEPKRASVLLIDYQETHRTIYASYLRYVGYNVTVAPDGIEGLSLFRKGYYDLVLCALEMPYLTGLQVARAVKEFSLEKGKKTPVIMVAGRASQLSQHELRQSGIDTVFLKPLRLDQLSESIKGLISEKRS